MRGRDLQGWRSGAVLGAMLKLASLPALLAAFGLLSAAEQPNLVILFADDLGYGELGCQGNPQIPTPHIDSIAEGGVRFTSGYVMGPNCSPSRAGLMSGRIPTRFGYEFNPIGARNEKPGIGFPQSETTLAEMLHELGYTTGLIGKWHLGGAADYHPHRHGFDEFFGFTHEGHYFVPPPYDGVTTMLRRRTLPGNEKGRWGGEGPLIYTTHMGHNEPDYDANNPIVRGGQPVVEPEYLTDAFTREAVDFIDRHQDKPFFLYLAYNAVHSPLQGKDEDMARFESIEDVHRRIFAAMLANMDDSVGEVLAKIDEAGIAENTLVVFLSDNGGPTRELTSSNAPLRGEKSSMYEGGLRVPFMMRWPGTLPEGVVEDEPVWSVDLYATAAVMGGREVPEASDGINLLPRLKGAEAWPERSFYWRQGSRTALRHGDWKLCRPERDMDSWRLYNLSWDLSEAEDIADEHPGKVADLKKRWSEFDAAMASPLFD